MRKRRNPTRPTKGDPYIHEDKSSGRTGTIYLVGRGIYKTHFRHRGEAKQNTFSTFENAKVFLDSEFKKIDVQPEESSTLFPLNRDRKYYYELEKRLKEEAGGASLWQAVDFFLVFNEEKKFQPMTVTDCITKFLITLEMRAGINATPKRKGTTTSSDTKNTPSEKGAGGKKKLTTLQIRTVSRHLGHFQKVFGSRKIHTLQAADIEEWLNTQIDSRTGELWSASTRKNTRGSLVSLARYAQYFLKALHFKGGEPNEFVKVPAPKVVHHENVDIFTPQEFKALLYTAVEHDIEFLPLLVFGGLLGLRPYEAHGEELKRDKLGWEAINWESKELNIRNQKIRTKRQRDVPLGIAAQAWLLPFKNLKGIIWNWKTAADGRYGAIRKKAKVRAVKDGLRHSYASYRVKINPDLDQVAAEMGNSKEELLRSYKRVVTVKEAKAWFSIMPPHGYQKKAADFLELLATRERPIFVEEHKTV